MSPHDTRTDIRFRGGNGYVTWRWLVGALLGMAALVVGGIAAIKSDIEVIKVDVKHINQQMTLERGMANRHDAEIRQCIERIIRLEAK